MSDKKISANFPYQSNYVDVYGSRMHYIEQGKGDPILFLHGIPTSCYLWRNIIPHLSSLGRCIAVDLIGLGKSDKPDIGYTIHDHIQYLEKFIETLNLHRITLVMHDWGSIIGFDYAMRYEQNCKGLIFYEAYVKPLKHEDLPLPYQEQFFILQQHENKKILDGINFVDTVLPQGMVRALSNEELQYYREPFTDKHADKPLRQYLRELPRGDGKSKADKLIAVNAKKLAASKLPKLMLYSVPGFITTIETAIWAKEHLPKLEIADIGESLHYAQETDPFLMGKTISIWLQGIEQATWAEK
jgi:haloalkane dehalogenase